MSLNEIREPIQKRSIEKKEKIIKAGFELICEKGFGSKNLDEKIHIAIHLIDDLCHEIVYHKHKDLDYDVMINLVIENILNLI